MEPTLSYEQAPASMARAQAASSRSAPCFSPRWQADYPTTPTVGNLATLQGWQPEGDWTLEVSDLGAQGARLVDFAVLTRGWLTRPPIGTCADFVRVENAWADDTRLGPAACAPPAATSTPSRTCAAPAAPLPARSPATMTLSVWARNHRWRSR